MACLHLGRCLLPFGTMMVFYDEFNLGHSTYLIDHFKAQNSKDQYFTKKILFCPSMGSKISMKIHRNKSPSLYYDYS